MQGRRTRRRAARIAVGTPVVVAAAVLVLAVVLVRVPTDGEALPPPPPMQTVLARSDPAPHVPQGVPEAVPVATPPREERVPAPGEASAAPPEENPTGIEFALHQAVPLHADRSLVWCATMQMAWDAMADVEGEHGTLPLTHANDMAAVAALNRRSFPSDAIDEDSRIALAGRYEDGIAERIDEAWVAKFGTAAPAPHLRLGPDDVVAFAALRKDLPFETPFRLHETARRFAKGTRGIRTFGLHAGDESAEARRAAEQVVVYVDASTRKGLPSEDDDSWDGAWVVELVPKGGADRIVLSSLEPKATLRETWLAASRRLKEGRAEPLPAGSELIVPRLRLNATHDFAELLNAGVLGHLDGSVSQAWQQITLALTETGGRVASEAVIGIARGGGPSSSVRFLDPFLLALVRRGSDEPYLLLWVGNDELMEPFGAERESGTR
jgi:hypothetical protein